MAHARLFPPPCLHNARWLNLRGRCLSALTRSGWKQRRAGTVMESYAKQFAASHWRYRYEAGRTVRCKDCEHPPCPSEECNTVC